MARAVVFSGLVVDDIGGEWGFSSAEVAMMLTPPYLSVRLGWWRRCPLSLLVIRCRAVGSMDTSTTLPATPVAMTASGYITSISRITQEVSAAREVPPFTGIGQELCLALDGYVHATTVERVMRRERGPSTQGGYAVVYSGNNVKNFDVRSDITYISAQTITLCDTHTDSLTGEPGATNTTLYWDANATTTPQSPFHQQGVDIHLYTRRVQLVRRVPRNYETQTATFSVTANGSEILYCEYYREHSIGQKEVFHPNTTYYDMYMGNYTYPGQPEWGCLEGFFFFATKSSWPGTDTIEIAAWYKINPYPPPIQSPEAVAEINQEYADMASALAWADLLRQ